VFASRLCRDQLMIVEAQQAVARCTKPQTLLGWFKWHTHLFLSHLQACHGSNLSQAARIGAICRLLDSGGGRHRTKRQGVFSVQCGGRTLFLRAPSTAEAEVRMDIGLQLLFTLCLGRWTVQTLW
jgi:hypothetical protein